MKPRDTAPATTQPAKKETTPDDNNIKRHKYPLNLWSFDDGMFFYESSLLLTTRDDFDYTGSTLKEQKKVAEETWVMPNELPKLGK